ncbi:MAG: hypothetical protein ACOCWM_05225, partial [Cyclobacteriaceae bacterium]
MRLINIIVDAPNELYAFKDGFIFNKNNSIYYVRIEVEILFKHDNIFTIEIVNDYIIIRTDSSIEKYDLKFNLIGIYTFYNRKTRQLKVYFNDFLLIKEYDQGSNIISFISLSKGLIWSDHSKEYEDFLILSDYDCLKINNNEIYCFNLFNKKCNWSIDISKFANNIQSVKKSNIYFFKDSIIIFKNEYLFNFDKNSGKIIYHKQMPTRIITP